MQRRKQLRGAKSEADRRWRNAKNLFWDAAERWIDDASTGITQSSNGAVVGPANKLLLLVLGESGTFDVGILRRLRGEFTVKVVRVGGVSLENKWLVKGMY